MKTLKTKNYNTHLLKKGLSFNETNLTKAVQSLVPKKNFGGDLLSFGANFIPGAGPILSPILGQFGNMLFEPKASKPLIPAKMNNNPFGNLFASGGSLNFKSSDAYKKWLAYGHASGEFAKTSGHQKVSIAGKPKKVEHNTGGVINNGFKQYNTGGHMSGNDLNIDENGNPSASPIAAVQNKENMFKIGLTPFIMSDELVNPETGKTFNQDAAKLNKSLPKASFNPEDKGTLKFGMERLAKLNDIMKGAKESYQMACGGAIKKMQDGGPFGYVPKRVDIEGNEYNYITDAPTYDPLMEPLAPLPQAGQYPTFVNRANQQREPEFSSFATPDTPYTPSPERMDSDSVTFPGVTSENVPSTERNPFNFNTIAIGLKGLGLAKSFADAIEKPEVEQTILPDYTKSDRYMQEANLDYTQAKQDAIGASNIGANVNRSASGNFSQYLNREANRTANLADALGNIAMQENNARSNLNLTRGNYEQGKAIDTANRKTQNRINNQQNQATADLADQKLFSEISQIGSEFNKYQNFRNQIANNKELQQYYINEALAIINSQNANFQLDPEFVNKLKSGNYSVDDVVKVVNMTRIK